MDIRHLILVSIAAISATACPTGSGVSGGNCGDKQPASVDTTLTEEQVQQLVTDYQLDDRSAIDCEVACQDAFWREGGAGSLSDVTDCMLNLDPNPGEMPEAEVGSVSCSGNEVFYCEGRRPLGHIEDRDCPQSLGEHLARCAQLEAASVVAFTQLAERLEAWEAPKSLVARCRAAADDEAQHASVVASLAANYGRAPRPAKQLDSTPSLEEVARDNAVEGCVYETWAALRAQLIAERADDPAIRQAYRQIATDEARHGQLAWDLHTWFCQQLNPAARADLEAAQHRALASLPSRARDHHNPAQLGLPAPQALGQLATVFCRQLQAA